MKKLLILSLLFLAASVSAQEAPLAAPIAKASEVKKVIGKVELSRSPVQALVQINVIDSAGEVARYYNVELPRVAGEDPAHPSASVVGFVNAIMTSAAGETGAIARRFDFRVLKYLRDNGYLADASSVVP